MGGLDFVLDDGSHDSKHIVTSLNTLYPLLSDGGLYMIEDLHTAYWHTFSGGYAAPSSFMTCVKTMIDDIHHWYHAHGQKIAATADNLGGIHIHDSIVVLDKQTVTEPRHSEVGG